MIAGALALALAALADLPQPAQLHQRESESETLFCSQSVRDELGGSATATIEVDREHSHIGSRISYRNGDFSAEWSVTDNALDANAKLLRFEAFADLSVGTVFPVDGRFVLDGSTVWRRSFSAPSGYLLDLARMPEPAEGEARCLRTQCLLPRILVRLTDADRIDLFATSRSEIVAETDGRVVARQVVAVPDWSGVKDFARTAMVELKQRVARRGCEPKRWVVER